MLLLLYANHTNKDDSHSDTGSTRDASMNNTILAVPHDMSTITTIIATVIVIATAMTSDDGHHES